ncbi:peptidyl-prolyl cis-trans isomerase FKBP11-like [Tigriopus californicus]|uniref:peptidyl-prolyl cis-trans isomerase FKBP11-like n=1 Tax=Tigriopus californicus TaxID=6832 RepID=UPI0027DA6C24|nr:peptidyl-prolyl cis-trans isomerase FKBP11-like [Tigriopus californicus]|eukprot:TCALIF_06888-PA protein Name:"Similar to FKBP11 Peptidyl-prolyl cis-trans isomerase FKBP11 (Bos taurus)" AED:0.36 eAED:0.36 QI:100/1/1/1/1/1/2/769/155
MEMSPILLLIGIVVSLVHGLREEITHEIISNPEYCPYTAEIGDTVKIEIKSARLDDPETGEIFDKSLLKHPRTFVLGSTNVIPGLGLQGLTRMCVDEIRRVKIPNTDRYFKDRTSQIAVGDKAKYVFYTVELLELSKGPSLKDLNPGLSFGGGEL